MLATFWLRTDTGPDRTRSTVWALQCTLENSGCNTYVLSDSDAHELATAFAAFPAPLLDIDVIDVYQWVLCDSQVVVEQFGMDTDRLPQAGVPFSFKDGALEGFQFVRVPEGEPMGIEEGLQHLDLV